MDAVVRATARILPNGRLHLHDGPIDLIVFADGDTDAAYRAATTRFATILDSLCEELHCLRAANAPWPTGPIAQTMRAAVEPLVRYGFITPMAAVAGAVAEAVLAAMTQAAPLTRAAVNNGGDIALHLAHGQQMRVGMVAKPEIGTTEFFGRLVIDHRDAARGLATSGCHGRSFSLGIADAVTVLARTAAKADAAATVIANAVDLPNHPGIIRRAARMLQPDSDLGERLVTREVPPLLPGEIETALARGRRRAEDLRAQGLIESAALHLQGVTALIERENVHA
jgi:ApbE superfamily uncharacterized protein (UPF0280 family)